MISAQLATLHEMQTVYGSEDLEDLLDVVQVDAENARVTARWLAKKANRK